MNREQREFFGLSAAVWLFIVVLSILTALISLVLWPAYIKFQTEAVHNSQGYVESKQRLLLDLREDYLELEASIAEATDNPDLKRALEAQQEAIIDQMRREAAVLDDPDVPPEVREFLRNHPN